MGFTCLSDFSMVTSHGSLSLFSLLKEILILILSPVLLLHSPPSDHDHDADHEYHDYHGPSTLSKMVVPVLFLAESIKRQLPVMSYSIFLEKSSSSSTKRQQVADDHDGVIINDKDNQDCECVVCTNRIEQEDKVRVPMNCRHVFHRECLDGWVDHGQPTCPLCRSKLVTTSQNHYDDQVDPWRMERMIYLFGDDYFLE